MYDKSNSKCSCMRRRIAKEDEEKKHPSINMSILDLLLLMESVLEQTFQD